MFKFIFKLFVYTVLVIFLYNYSTILPRQYIIQEKTTIKLCSIINSIYCTANDHCHENIVNLDNMKKVSNTINSIHRFIWSISHSLKITFDHDNDATKSKEK